MNKTLSSAVHRQMLSRVTSGDELKEYFTEIYLLNIKHSLPAGLKR